MKTASPPIPRRHIFVSVGVVLLFVASGCADENLRNEGAYKAEILQRLGLPKAGEGK